MEFLNPPIPKIHRISSTISVFPPRFPLQIGSKNRGRRFRVSKSANPLFTHSLSSSSPQSFRLSAHSGNPIRRRNSLRKKLVHNQKVRQNPLPLVPNSDFQNPLQEGLNSVSIRENSTDDEIRVHNLGNSNLLTKLENWVDQYRRDIEFWGIGTGKIFTVLEDLDGNVKEVNVNQDEISRRSIDGDFEFRESPEVNARILYAKDLAREMEKGGNLIPRNSSVTEFVAVGKEKKLSLVSSIQDAIFRPDNVSKVGAMVICCVAVFLVVKKSFGFRNEKVNNTRSEKGNVEVIREPVESANVWFEKPKLDRKELMDNILKAKASKNEFVLPDQAIESSDFDRKIEEIKAMARQAREIERKDRSLADKDEKDAHIVDEGLPNETEEINTDGKEVDGNARQILEGNGAVVSALLPEGDNVKCRNEESSLESGATQESPIGKPKVILSEKEAREFLSKKHGNLGLKQAPSPKDDEGPSVFHEGVKNHSEKGAEMDSLAEKKFHEVEPVPEKIGDGFSDNHVAAREKSDGKLDSSADANLISKVPVKQEQFIDKKLDKLEREMEVFGPEAVVSKYRENAEEEEDYLWWLDLPHVLCIELYTTEGEKQKIGFYALEMAGDLELEPKPVNVIAFEDASDCRNLCYIIQSCLKMLGNGHALIVPRPPKDAFREVKGNGYGVTVIRKGELKLNVDQTLEEVEEEICEIMKEQSVDVSTMTKGVLGSGSGSGSSSKPKKSATRKRSKKALKTDAEKQQPAKARARNPK